MYGYFTQTLVNGLVSMQKVVACCHTELLYTWNSPLQEENFIFSKSNKAHTIGSAIEHPTECREAHSEQRGAVPTFQV